MKHFIDSSGYEFTVQLELYFKVAQMYNVIAPKLYVWKYNFAYTSPNDMIPDIGIIQNVGIRFFMAENLIVDLESCRQVH